MLRLRAVHSFSHLCILPVFFCSVPHLNGWLAIDSVVIHQKEIETPCFFFSRTNELSCTV